MIAVDWGTSSFRAYRLAPGGAVLDRRDAPRGIMQVEDGRFAEVLRDAVGPWLAEGEGRVLLSGMIGSRQGWVEAPYVACPAGLDELAAGLVAVPFEGASVRLVPGLRQELVESLIRTLPKASRRSVVPAPDFAARAGA